MAAVAMPSAPLSRARLTLGNLGPENVFDPMTEHSSPAQFLGRVPLENVTFPRSGQVLMLRTQTKQNAAAATHGSSEKPGLPLGQGFNHQREPASATGTEARRRCPGGRGAAAIPYPPSSGLRGLGHTRTRLACFSSHCCQDSNRGRRCGVSFPPH